ncbi:MAG: 5-formyltetrahydrofolate cyclo-ligase [Planctomycetota bacterium]
MLDQDALAARKAEIRAAAHTARKEQPNKDSISVAITDAVIALPEYQSATTVMWYVDVRAEVRTRHVLPELVSGDKNIVIPFCVDGELELFHLESMAELEEGMYRILEPKSELRDVAAKRVSVEQLDLILVPGVAFDVVGGRTGHGKGYYDKLLENARPTTPLVALAFDCQIFDEIPMQSHDIYMDKVVTQSKVHTGKGRG